VKLWSLSGVHRIAKLSLRERLTTRAASLSLPRAQSMGDAPLDGFWMESRHQSRARPYSALQSIVVDSYTSQCYFLSKKTSRSSNCAPTLVRLRFNYTEQIRCRRK